MALCLSAGLAFTLASCGEKQSAPTESERGYNTMAEATLSDSESNNFTSTEISGEEVLSFTLNKDGNSYSAATKNRDVVSVQIPALYNGRPVTALADDAFENCALLEYVIIPDSVTSIGSSAFYNCESLTEIAIPDSVTSIGSSAFYGCANLTYISFGADSQLSEIGNNAFYACSNLAEITLRAGIASIGSSAFDGCNRLVIHCEAALKPSGWINSWNADERPVVWNCNSNIVADDGYIYAAADGIRYRLKDGEAAVYSQPATISGNLAIPSSVTYGDSSYNVTKITDRAFYGCDNLTAITISAGITTTGRYTFYGCTSLAEVILPESLTTIDDSAFERCASLEHISIPDNVTAIGYAAFNGCTGLKEVTFGTNSRLEKIGNWSFNGCLALQSFTIPQSTAMICSHAFSNCTALTSVTFENATGWTADATQISTSELGNAVNAATMLTKTYITATLSRS